MPHFGVHFCTPFFARCNADLCAWSTICRIVWQRVGRFLADLYVSACTPLPSVCFSLHVPAQLFVCRLSVPILVSVSTCVVSVVAAFLWPPSVVYLFVLAWCLHVRRVFFLFVALFFRQTVKVAPDSFCLSISLSIC